MIVLRTSNVTMLIDDVMQSRTTTQANLNELKHGWTVARRNLYRPRARPRMTHLSPDACRRHALASPACLELDPERREPDASTSPMEQWRWSWRLQMAGLP